MRFLIFLGLICAGWFCTSKSNSRVPVNIQRPNIIFILADDLGYNELGCYGQTIIKTPRLDRLAREGVRFTNFYSGSTVCAPSRCTFLTGKHTGHAYIRDNAEKAGRWEEEEYGQEPLDTVEVTIAELLRDQGYATAVIGKWGLGMPTDEGNPVNHGFDHFYGYACQKHAHTYYPTHLWRNNSWDTLDNVYVHPHPQPSTMDPLNPQEFAAYKGKDYSPDFMHREAIRFVKEHREKPFFLYYAIPIPHLSLQIPDQYLDKYAHLPDTPYLGQRGYTPHQRPRAAYAAMITYMDSVVGNLLDSVQAWGLDQNTLVVFTSDNGATIPGLGGVDIDFFNGLGQLRGWKTNLYEGGIRVPCLVKWPGQIPANQVSDHVAALWDFFPTFTEITQIKYNGPVDGLSLWPLLTGKKKPGLHDYLYWEFAANSSQAVRKGPWKAIRQNLIKNPYAPLELYNLDTDPGEKINVADKHSELVQDMLEIMKKARTPSVISKFNFIPSN